jgi:adenosylcobinamide-GDP ribazoletransferase
MLVFFPLVGFVISSIVVFIYTFFSPSWYMAIVCSTLYMLLYGFLHTEAITDVADAIYASHNGKDPYLIIKEPTIGAMGLLYTVAFVILKIASLTYLFLNNLFFEFIVIAILSRVFIVIIIYFNDFRSSFVNLLKSSIKIQYLIFIIIIYSLLSFYLINLYIVYLIIIGFVVGFIFSRYFKNKLKFLNGDTLGCTLEITELIMLISIANLLV